MPQSNPAFDAYIASAAPFAQPVLRHVRKIVRAACPEVDEQIKWGHLAFLASGKMMANAAAFKAHCAFGFWHQQLRREIERERGRADNAMGLLGRIARLEDLPDDAALTRYVQRAAELNASGAPARPPPKKKAAPKVPADLAAALKKQPRTAAAFARFSPSHRREYIEWILEAKRAETRQKRLAQTLAWLAEGKSRNWKYEGC